MPQMNFFHGKCTTDDRRRVCVEFEGRLFPVDEDTVERMDQKNLMGEEIIIGVRPEDMLLDPKGIKSNVRVCEKLGSTTYLYLAYGKEDVAVRVPADSPAERGDDVCFSFQRDKMHLFDAYTKQRI